MSNITTTVDTYLAMWNETDAVRRGDDIERAWAGDGSYIDPQLGGLGATPPSARWWPPYTPGSPVIASAEPAASMPITTCSVSPGSSWVRMAPSLSPASTSAYSLPTD